MFILDWPVSYRIVKKESVRRYIVYGVALGYPSCCIAQFVLELMKHKAPAKERITKYGRGKEWINTGYVPCDSCIESGKVQENIRKAGVYAGRRENYRKI